MTQKQKILRELKSGRKLTSMSGFRMGIVMLPNRVNELRANGVPIKDFWQQHPITKARYKVYHL